MVVVEAGISPVTEMNPAHSGTSRCDPLLIILVMTHNVFIWVDAFLDA